MKRKTKVEKIVKKIPPFPVLILVFIASLYLLFGVMFMIAPERFASGLGFSDLNSVAIVELRAVYGGLELALGAAILLMLYRNKALEAANLALITFVGFSGGRIVGMAIDGVVGLHAYYLLLELVLGALSAWSYFKLRREKR